jgi:beta-N-acetylhexosaminidase
MSKFYAFIAALFVVLFTPVAMANEPTLREKIGQMFVIGFDGKTVNSDSFIAHAIEEENIGGVILFDYNYSKNVFDKNIESKEQVQELNRKLQYFTKKANDAHQRDALSLLISVDYEGGVVNPKKITSNLR